MFRGPWHQDHTGKWRGNPCQAAIVVDTYRACKNRQGEPERRHALPMKIRGMNQVHDHFLKECPTLEQCVDQSTLAARAEWLQYMAYSTLTWNVWGR